LESSENNNRPEIWGGVECTVVRINDQIHDQIEFSGHEKRLDDFRLFADLGITTIRYPLLWEKYAKDKEGFLRLHDERLNRLSQLNIDPIAGLVHHGSGPFFTNLLDPAFPELLAEYAADISARYPHIRYYTPVNEPLTTARFSGLYGVWYPHLKNDTAFLQILINELKGIVLAMRAVQQNNPDARLIQTEDLCKVHSTDLLKYQADFENERRWLTYDLLTGRFNRDHTLWNFITGCGIAEKDIEFFIENAVEPAVCGFNYYLSSERFLDHRLENYPEALHGGNGRHAYADVEAVRVPEVKIDPAGLLREAWERFRLPLAITEVHLACTREEQMRWLNEIYGIALQLKQEKIDFRAITTWSFFGSFDWNTLLQSTRRQYESGIYDVRSGEPRATALAGMVKSLNLNRSFTDGLMQVPGWWRRDIRNVYGVRDRSFEPVGNDQMAPLLILGSTGSLGNAFARICHTRGLVHRMVHRPEFEITSQQSIEKVIEQFKPWAVINTIGFSKIDEAEKDPMTCFKVNTLGPSMLANICHSSGIKLLTFSSDQVFNGKKRNPYLETDRPSPLNIYGQSKRKAEEIISMVNPDALIIRSSAFYNPWHADDLLMELIHTNTSKEIYFPSDIIFSPTYVADLVNTALDLMIDGESGIWHLSNQEEISFYQFVRMAYEMAGKNDRNLVGIPSRRFGYAAERPHYSVLSNSKGISLSPLSVALENYLNELTVIA
jgi:dTDP-4-dehydrorhamnose reductase